MIGGSLASIQVIMNEMKYILFGKFFVPTQNDGDVVSQSIFSRPLPASFFFGAASYVTARTQRTSIPGSNPVLYGTLSAAGREAGGIAVSTTFGRE